MVVSGNLENYLQFLPLRKTNDPTVRKPTDWDDQIQTDDLNEIKPEVIGSPYSALLGFFIPTEYTFDVVELCTSFVFLILCLFKGLG